MRIGSVSKLITALLAVELILDGQVAVDEPVELRLNALAGTPAGRATLRELLSHRAGLAEVWPGDVWRDQSQHPDSTWLDVVARKSAEQEQRLPRDALVGAARHDSYRNVHYAIAAAYLESSVGSFQDVLGDKLLVRRGWDAVWLDASTLEPNAAACGHLGNALVLDAAHAHSVLELGADWARAAGGMLSTADQLAAIGADLPIPVEMPSPISNEISDEVPNEMPDGPIESSVVHSQPGHDHPGVAHPDGSPSDRQRAQPSRRDAARMELLAPEGVCAPKDAACRAAVRDGIKTLIEQSAQGRLGSQPTAATQGDIYTLAWAIRATAGSNVPRGASDPGAPPVQPSDSVQIPLSYGLRGATGDSAAVLLVRPAVLSFALISNDGWPYHGTTLRAATVAATDQSPRQPPLRSPW